ncbi:transcriptional regulator with XRE-family HTH domain [Rhodococcus sp. 27YEA15]|uniref:helix-turn-helix domain-containing protein n=1 Tax=Rhodococcus sp. 27YEA15 TaxID=3156259 RepID=UPI003C7D83D1
MTAPVKLPWNQGREATRRRGRLRQIQGIPARVPTARVQAHVQELRAAGMSGMMIANAAGVSKQTVTFIEDGTYEWVLFDRANAILGVSVHPHPAQANVLSAGAVRRLQALRALGFTVPELADRLGTKRQNLLESFRRPTCTYARWVAVRDLYDELSSTPVGQLIGSPHARARALAARSGFLLPMEWEGYDIDDPRVTPPRTALGKSARMKPTGPLDEVLVQRLLEGRHVGRAPKREQYEAVILLTAKGLSAAAIATRLGISDRTVTRLRAAA